MGIAEISARSIGGMVMGERVLVDLIDPSDILEYLTTTRQDRVLETFRLIFIAFEKKANNRSIRLWVTAGVVFFSDYHRSAVQGNVRRWGRL